MLIILFKPVHPLSAGAGPRPGADCIVRAKLKIVRIASAQFIMLYGAVVSAVWHGSGLGLGGCTIVLFTDPLPFHLITHWPARIIGDQGEYRVCAGTPPSAALLGVRLGAII